MSHPTTEARIWFAPEEEEDRFLPEGPRVLEVDSEARRMRLSVKAVHEAHESTEVRQYSERAGAETPQGFGTLGDKLRDVFKPRH